MFYFVHYKIIAFIQVSAHGPLIGLGAEVWVGFNPNIEGKNVKLLGDWWWAFT